MKNDKKSFKFYRSYYDVAVLLKPKHRLQFLMAILESHFHDHIITELSPTAHLAFIGQSHAIDKQLLGYKSMKKNELSDLPYEGSSVEIISNNNKDKENNIINKDKEESLTRCMEVTLKDSMWVKKAKTNKNELLHFNDHLVLQGQSKKSIIEYKRHFVNWKRKNPKELIELSKQNRDDSW